LDNPEDGAQGREDGAARYRALRSSDAYAQARDLDARIRLSEPVETELVWHSPTASAYRVGNDLQVLDRELRRAAAFVQGWQEDRPLPRPLSVQQGGLDIASSSAGSFDAVLQAVGAVSMVLLSDPVQLLLTAQALISEPFTLKAWLNRRQGDPIGPPTVTLQLSGGTKATGRRIQFSRRYADGSEDLIVVE
jgi:hypothetical protein